MTMPDERTRAVLYTRSFLFSLLRKDETPGVPKKIREAAGNLLRHFPGEYDLALAAQTAPKVFEAPKFESPKEELENEDKKRVVKRRKPAKRVRNSSRTSKSRR